VQTLKKSGSIATLHTQHTTELLAQNISNKIVNLSPICWAHWATHRETFEVLGKQKCSCTSK